MSVIESTPKCFGRRSVTSVTTSSRAAWGSARSIMKRSRVISSEGAKDGALPVRTAWAPRTIMLPAAWRKMWVSSAIGTGGGGRGGARLDELGEGLAGADRGELVGVADEDDVGLCADGSEERDE